MLWWQKLVLLSRRRRTRLLLHIWKEVYILFVAVILFLVGLLLLIWGGDKFVDGAVGISRRFFVPEILIGATVVSIGTTLPEVLVSASAAIGGHGEIAYGNAIGSIICNTALIAAITMAVRPVKVDTKSLRVPAVFFGISALFYMAVAYFFKDFSRLAGGILLCLFLIYIILSAKSAVKSVPKTEKTEKEESPEPIKKHLFFLILGAAAIAVGADLLVDNGTKIAQVLGVPESVIALTFVALGTSLPELTTAVVSLIKGHGALSIGNILGANLFNLVLVSGVSTLLSPFPIPQTKQILGTPASLVLDIPVMVLVSLLMLLPVFLKKRVTRLQGISLLLVYALFCAGQFIL